jgi:hypothetical protein
MMSATVASKVPFSEIGGLLEKLSAKKAVSETKKSLVRDFIKTWREFHDKLHADDPNTVMAKIAKIAGAIFSAR